MKGGISVEDLSTLDWLSLILVIIGALNWGLIGLFEFNLVSTIFGEMTAITRIIYTLVGLGGLYLIAAAPKFKR